MTPAGVSCNGTVPAFDARSAVLLLRAPGLHLPAATIGDTAAMRAGQPVTVGGVRHGVITNTDAVITGLTAFADHQ